jgi:hypothetical protein
MGRIDRIGLSVGKRELKFRRMVAGMREVVGSPQIEA